MVHDHDTPDLGDHTAVVIPITSATAEVNRARRQNRDIKSSYVPLERENYFWLDHDSYASIGQTFPASRKWFDEKPIGEILPEKMLEIDFQFIRTFGLNAAVEAVAQIIVEQRAAMDQVAGGHENNQ
ncbi:hypothetical protein [Paenibacillus chitinolyticus]|uniref:hypothetical protein n=1 Tax=Paenibacillus chitinolyticus TaxID=79263 RepID=UPI001C47B2A9|nr:hypothetical protein [Paenibacillus chitinolyticus]MBV6717282.1 hypothetical protein [Paenibacillus chitinolyticus]